MIPVCSTLISYLSFHVTEDRTGWSNLVILMSVRPGEDMRAEKMSSVMMNCRFSDLQTKKKFTNTSVRFESMSQLLLDSRSQ